MAEELTNVQEQPTEVSKVLIALTKNKGKQKILVPSMEVAPTKTLAKIANHIGKKRPEGVFMLPDDPTEILAALPAGEVWGVGRRLSLKLRAEQIFTAKDLRDASDDVIRSVGGVVLSDDYYWTSQKFSNDRMWSCDMADGKFTLNNGCVSSLAVRPVKSAAGYAEAES